VSKISIIGRGINPSLHLSLAALKALRTADKIVGIESEKEFWKELQEEFNLCENVFITPVNEVIELVTLETILKILLKRVERI
jgi:precorrin-6B methylase 1